MDCLLVVIGCFILSLTKSVPVHPAKMHFLYYSTECEPNGDFQTKLLTEPRFLGVLLHWYNSPSPNLVETRVKRGNTLKVDLVFLP